MTLIKLPWRISSRLDDTRSAISDKALSSGSTTPGSSTTVLSGVSQAPSVEVHHLPQHEGLLVKIQPPHAPTDLESSKHSTKRKAPSFVRAPCDIVLVIDVSASMGSEAPAPDDTNQTKEDYGLSVLDLTKHAARTILETLNEQDRLAIVAYSTDVQVVQPLEPMTKPKKTKAIKSIDALVPLSSTNMWNGITTGIELFDDEQAQSGRVPAIMVLTDGMPNHMCPAQGYVPKIRDIKARYDGGLPAAIHTFGFGYSLRSGLLKSIAEIGGGNYAFIPDAGMIGTVFVHAVANLQTTYADKATLRLTYARDLVIEETMGDTVDKQEPVALPEHENATELTIPLGALQYGQSRDILLRAVKSPAPTKGVNVASQVCVMLNYARMSHEEHVQTTSITLDESSKTTTSLSDAEIAYHISRSQICAYLSSLIPAQDNGEHSPLVNLDGTPREKLRTLISGVCERADTVAKCNGGRPDAANQSLVDDLAGSAPKGQISLAITRDDYWRRWGQHYLPSLLNAHSRQICNSFKDPGPLQYGANSPLFIQCRDRLDAAFDGIPPPKPSRENRSGHVYSGSINMRRFHSSSNPCFAGSTRVVLASGGGEYSLPMSKLRRGMAVLTPRGPRKVVAVLVTPVTRELMCRVSLDGKVRGCGDEATECGLDQGRLIVTPWHPLGLDDRGDNWIFPAQITDSVVRYTGCIYSVLLQPDADPAAHAMVVGAGGRAGFCLGVTLGHGVVSKSSSDIRAHTFFGDYVAVVASFKKLGLRKDGLVVGGGSKRDRETGKVCGFKHWAFRKHGPHVSRHVDRMGVKQIQKIQA